MANYRLEMREHTRRAVSDVCNTMLARYGFVLSFSDVERIASDIDRELMRYGDIARTMTPDEWKKEGGDGVKKVEL